MGVLQRFWFRVFRDTIRASYTVVSASWSLLFPRVGMTICDQPEERSLLCLKERDSYMYCRSCTFPSRSLNNSTPHQPPSDHRMRQLSSEDEYIVTHSSCHCPKTSVRHRDGKLTNVDYPSCDFICTIKLQLSMATTIRRFELPIGVMSRARRSLALPIAHDNPPAISAFAGLGSYPYFLHKLVAYERLQEMDLGLICSFFDLINEYLKTESPLPFTKPFAAANEIFIGLSLGAHLPYYRPFRTSKDDR